MASTLGKIVVIAGLMGTLTEVILPLLMKGVRFALDIMDTIVDWLKVLGSGLLTRLVNMMDNICDLATVGFSKLAAIAQASRKADGTCDFDDAAGERQILQCCERKGSVFTQRTPLGDIDWEDMLVLDVGTTDPETGGFAHIEERHIGPQSTNSNRFRTTNGDYMDSTEVQHLIREGTQNGKPGISKYEGKGVILYEKEGLYNRKGIIIITEESSGRIITSYPLTEQKLNEYSLV